MSGIDIDQVLRTHVRAMSGNRLLTQQAIADAIGLHRTALANWLSNRRTLPVRNASRLITLIGPARFAKELIEAAKTSDEKGDRLTPAIKSRAEIHRLARQLAQDGDVSQSGKEVRS